MQRRGDLALGTRSSTPLTRHQSECCVLIGSHEDVLEKFLGDGAVRFGHVVSRPSVQPVAAHVEPPVAHEHRLVELRTIGAQEAGLPSVDVAVVPGLLYGLKAPRLPDNECPYLRRNLGTVARRSRSWCRGLWPTRDLFAISTINFRLIVKEEVAERNFRFDQQFAVLQLD
ncbi:hypothetical protein B566_EDAN016682 [Ephemera danica]|nr:hypothetical protein B566_EDAN016682 [Ephemera danica]